MQTFILPKMLLQADGGLEGAEAPLEGAQPAGPDAQQQQNGEQQGPGNMFLILAIIMAIFWILVFRPESKRRKEREKKVESIKKGDSVVTTGGILGKVWKVEDKHVVLIVDKDKDYKMSVMKTSVFEVGGSDDAAKESK